MTEELFYLSATEALEQFRTRQLSPVELVDALLARADEVEPVINAFTARYDDEARSAARDAERRYANGTARPLEGVTVAVKELTAVAGKQHTFASMALADNVATVTAPMVERIFAAGGIMHARTTTPEFGVAAFTESRLYGLTRNPWSLEHGTQGSSGGSAAALAIGSTTLATGTDSAGSLRLPAAACGIVGFKPPSTRVPRLMPFALETCEHEGPMARTVSDVALLYELIAGAHPADPTSHGGAPVLRPADDGVKGMSLAVLTGIAGLDIDPDVADNNQAAIEALRDAGAEVVEVDLGWTLATIMEATKQHFAAMYGPQLSAVIAMAPELANDYAIAVANEVARYSEPPGFVLRARELTGEIWEPLREVFDRHEALLLPALAMPGLPHDDHFLDHGPMVAGVVQDDNWVVGTTVMFNLCNWCPAMSVPSGLARNGVPTGLQIVGRPYDEASVFRAAWELERVRPFPTRPNGMHEGTSRTGVV